MSKIHKNPHRTEIDAIGPNSKMTVKPDICHSKPITSCSSNSTTSTVKNIINLLPKQFQITLLLMATLVIIYALLRIGFLAYNHRYFTGSSTVNILLSFFYGLRFDLSGIMMLNSAILLIYNLPGYPARNRWFSAVLFVFFCTVNLIGICLSIADYAYYPNILRRITYEPLMMGREIWDSLPGLLVDQWPLFGAALITCAGFIWISFRMLSYFAARIHYRFIFFRECTCFLLLIGLSVLGIRGGLQSQPIRQSHAFFSQDYRLGYLAMNTPFNIILSMNQQAPEGLDLMPEDEARRMVQKMLYKSEEHYLDRQYPFLRRYQSLSAKSAPQINIVILIMESWNAGDVGALGANPSPTPHFDRLAADGWLFTNFMANGSRSMEILPAILSSIPSLFNVPLIGSRSEPDRFLGMGTIVSRHGYTTSFHHGARTGSMGFDIYSRRAGFQHYFGMEDLPDLKDSDWDGNWGVFDHIFYSDVVKRLDNFHQPFLSVVYSLSPHDPMTIPADLKAKFAPFAGEGRYRQALRYSDYSLGLFFEQARRRSWFSNTVFFIVGDHAYYPPQGNFRAAFHIPLLIYAPGIVEPKQNNQLAAQIDILPTIIEALGFQDAHASMGKSFQNPSKKRWAVVKYGSDYGLFAADYLFLSNLNGKKRLYSFPSDPLLTKDIKGLFPELAARYEKYLLAYLQEVTMSIKQDRIYKE